MNKVIIVTADKRTLSWTSLPAKKRAIRDALNTMKNASFTLDVVHEQFIPEVNEEGRMTHAWFSDFAAPYFRQGYDFILVHMKDTQRKKWGIKPTLRGSRLNAPTEMMMAYFWADEGTLRNGYNQFIQTALHELSHAYCAGAKASDLTHQYHDTNPDIRGIFARYDMAKYQPTRMSLKREKTLLEGILSLWERVSVLSAVKRHREAGELLPLVQEKADAIVDAMALLGHPVRIVEGYRSPEKQNELYAQGRTTPGRVVTNAKGGESFHQHGVAVDFVFRREGYEASEALWQTLGSIGRSQGFEWGGDWKGSLVDRPHFELTLGYKLRDFQKGTVDYSKYL